MVLSSSSSSAWLSRHALRVIGECCYQYQRSTTQGTSCTHHHVRLMCLIHMVYDVDERCEMVALLRDGPSRHDGYMRPGISQLCS
jgi:hypothetical protein